MKKLITIAVCIVLMLGAMACTTDATKLERMQQDIYTINNNDSKVWLYKYQDTQLQDLVDNVTTVQSVDEIDIDNQFSLIALHGTIGDLTEQDVIGLFDILSKTSKLVLVGLFDFEDYQFLRYVYPEDYRSYFERSAYARVLDNWGDDIAMRDTQVDIKGTPADFDEHLVKVLASRIREYNQSQ
ncbi:MAG: hypothetical protein LBK70_00060 [Clostridiales bacterium]|jgi:hypothetical protein|nr:hypothetical protein [Clostridiales bacterium]